MKISKIVLDKRLQLEMMKFFMKTSVPRILKERSATI